MAHGALGFVTGLAALSLRRGVNTVENGLTIGSQGPGEHPEEYYGRRQDPRVDRRKRLSHFHQPTEVSQASHEHPRQPMLLLSDRVAANCASNLGNRNYLVGHQLGN